MEAAEARVRELLSSTDDKVELRSNDLPALIKIMESLTDDQIRDKALNFISKTEIPKSDVDQPHSELNGLLLAKGSVKEWMMKGLENNNPDSLKVWKAVVGLLGKTLHQPKEGTLLMNSLLQVVEKAFKHSDVSMRVEANYCWMALMDNFALNHSILTSPKRINLIVRPLISCANIRSEEQVRSKFVAWWHFIGLLGDNIHKQMSSVVLPFLKFCYSSTVTTNTNDLSQPKKSPVKTYSSLEILYLEAIAILFCGLDQVKVSHVDIDLISKNLTNSVFKPEHFVANSEVLLQGVTEVFEALETRKKSHRDQFSCIIQGLGRLAEQTANDKMFKRLPEMQDAVGKYLDKAVNLMYSGRCKSDDGLSIVIDILQQLAKIPDDILSTSSIWEFEKGLIKESPAQVVIKVMLKTDYLNVVFPPNSHKASACKDKYLSLFYKFLQAGCLHKTPPKGLDIIEVALEVLNERWQHSLQPSVKDDVVSHFWKNIAQVYVQFVDKYDEVNQTNLKLSHKLSASINLLTFPIIACLNTNSKPFWKLWIEALDKFNGKAPLLFSYKTLEVEELITDEILKKTDDNEKELSPQEWNNLCNVVCHQLVNNIPYQSLSQESQGLTCKGVPKITRVVVALVKLLPQMKDKTAATNIVQHLGHLTSSITHVDMQKLLFKQVSPALEVILNKSLMDSQGKKFESAIKVVFDSVVNRLQSRYEGPFDLEFLTCLQPFFKASLGHKKRDIKSKAHQMWQLTFAPVLKDDEIPNAIKDLLKASQNDESLKSSQSMTQSFTDGDFAVPLSFTNILAKTTTEVVAASQPKPMISSEPSNKKKAKKATNIDEENSQDFVSIQSPSTANKKRPLTEHQREKLKQRRDDIPALYSELSMDNSQPMTDLLLQSSNSIEEVSQDLISSQQSSVAAESQQVCTDNNENSDVDDDVIEIEDSQEDVNKDTRMRRKGRKPQKHVENVKKSRGRPRKKPLQVPSQNEESEPPTVAKRGKKRKKSASPQPQSSEVQPEQAHDDDSVSVSAITTQLNSDTVVHVSRLSPNQLKISQESPVKVVMEEPLVIEPAVLPLQSNNAVRGLNFDASAETNGSTTEKDEIDVIESSQPSSLLTSVKNASKKRRHSYDGVSANTERPKRKAAQKVNQTIHEESKPEGKENEGPPSSVAPMPSAGKKVKTNKYGESQLHVAIKKGDLEKAKTLINEGADVNCKDYAGWTPLHEAAAHVNSQSLSVLQLLVSSGADINAKANDGSTPLHDAVSYMTDDCVQYLIDHGADMLIENNDAKTPKAIQEQLKESPIKPIREPPVKKAKEEWITTEEPPAEEENDKLNDSVNSILATPLDVSMDEVVSVPATQDDEESVASQDSQQSDVIESSQPKEDDANNSLIKPPLPIIKINTKQNILTSVFSSRAAKLLDLSKNKKNESPSTSSACSSIATGSPNQMLMSPRVELNTDVNTTPTQPKPWQKFAPSPSNASPSASILKRNTSEETPPRKRRRVQFTDPPVSDQVVIPRCPSGKVTRQKLNASRFNRDMFLNVAKDLSKDTPSADQDSSGLYEATPPMENASEVPNNCIYPALIECDEPVSSILHNLTTQTWHKAAEKSLSDHGIKTIADLSKLTIVKASALRSLKPPNNLATIKEALRKFEKSWLRRGKDKYTEKKSLNSSCEELEETESPKEQSPTAAPVVDIQSTPEEEDETMKELYERPSPSPTESIELIRENNVLETTIESSEKNTIESEVEKMKDENEEKEMDTVQVKFEETKETKAEVPYSEQDTSPMLEDSTVQETFEEETEVKSTTDCDVQAVQETNDNEVQASPTTLECETMTPIISREDFSVQKNVDCTEMGMNTDKKPMTSASVQTAEIAKEDKLKELLAILPELDISDLTDIITQAAQVIRNKTNNSK